MNLAKRWVRARYTWCPCPLLCRLESESLTQIWTLVSVPFIYVVQLFVLFFTLSDHVVPFVSRLTLVLGAEIDILTSKFTECLNTAAVSKQ